MNPSRNVAPSSAEEDRRLDASATTPLPAKRSSGVRRKAVVSRAIDPLEEALLSRPVWDSRAPEPAVHDLLYRFSVGDVGGAIAAANELLDGRRIPALTVSLDVLDELELDERAILVLAQVDGTTQLSRVLRDSCLERADALRAVCDLVERHILVLRSPS